MEDLKGLVEDYLNNWSECSSCNMIVRNDLLKYKESDILDTICKDCYKKGEA